ncbi:MAG: Yip1 family protein [Methanolinea sp.]|nr:Yip1 family protein [Methanolinea sp.]
MKSVADLLFSPGRFFAEGEGREPGLLVPGLIAVAGASVSALAAYAMSPLYREMFAPAGAGEEMGMVIGVAGAVGAFAFFILVWWVLMACAFHVVSIPLGGQGKFSGTLAATGYGLLPVVVGNAISFAVLLATLPSIAVPAVRNVRDPSIVQEAIAGLQRDPAMQQYTLAATVISVIFLAWSANIWIFGVGHARKLKTRDAVVTVLVPAGIMAAFSIGSYVTGALAAGGS